MTNVSNPAQSQFFVLDHLTKVWEWLLLRLLIVGNKLVRHFLHLVFSVFYFNRGKVVPPIKNALLLKTATQLAADIREGRLKSEDVIRAYINRIAEVEPFINATTYRRNEEALREARLVDELIESGQMSKKQIATEKPLLGIPVSVKLNIKIKGFPITGGSLDSKNDIATEDADAIKFMKKSGAIILASTNAPEKAFGVDTSNKLYGRTNNPYNTCRSPGGSSGGEGALIASGASLIGLGNDTAGSIRIPPLFCGVFGHLPSKDLVSPHGQLINTGNITTIAPMTRYAEDLTVAMKVLTLDKGNAHFDRTMDFKKLKIYYIHSMGNPFEGAVADEIRDALEKVTSYFRTSYGVKAIQVNSPLLKESNAMFLHFLISSISIDDTKRILGIPKDLDTTKEILKSCVGISNYTFNIPFILKFLKCPLWYKEKDVPYYKSLTQQLKQMFDELMDEDTILLCPTLTQTATYHVEAEWVFPDVCYLGTWNLLGLPATHCPLGLNKEGLPVGIQVVACRNNDSLNLAVARELERAFGGWVPPRKK